MIRILYILIIWSISLNSGPLASRDFNPAGVVYINSSEFGNNYPDLELLLGASETHPDASYPKDLIRIFAVLLRPKSFGYIKLASSNHADEPKLDPKYLSSASDMNRLLEGKSLICHKTELGIILLIGSILCFRDSICSQFCWKFYGISIGQRVAWIRPRNSCMQCIEI